MSFIGKVFISIIKMQRRGVNTRAILHCQHPVLLRWVYRNVSKSLIFFNGVRHFVFLQDILASCRTSDQLESTNQIP